MTARPLIGWDIFDFSSETAARNSRKLNWKQDLNVFYQVFVFWPIGKPAAPASDWWDIFDFSSETAERNPTKHDSKQDINVLYQVCGVMFRAHRKTKIAARPLIGSDIFNFSFAADQWNSTKLDRKQDPNVLYQIFVYRAYRVSVCQSVSISVWSRSVLAFTSKPIVRYRSFFTQLLSMAKGCAFTLMQSHISKVKVIVHT